MIKMILNTEMLEVLQDSRIIQDDNLKLEQYYSRTFSNLIYNVDTKQYFIFDDNNYNEFTNSDIERVRHLYWNHLCNLGYLENDTVVLNFRDTRYNSVIDKIARDYYLSKDQLFHLHILPIIKHSDNKLLCIEKDDYFKMDFTILKFADAKLYKLIKEQ